MDICLNNQLPEFSLSFKRAESRRRHVENSQEEKGVITSDVGRRGAWRKDDHRELGAMFVKYRPNIVSVVRSSRFAYPADGVGDVSDEYNLILQYRYKGDRTVSELDGRLSPALFCSSADDDINSILDSISSMRSFNLRYLFPGWLVASMQVLPDFWHLGSAGRILLWVHGMTGMLEEYCCGVAKSLVISKLGDFVGIDAFGSHFLLLLFSHGDITRFQTFILGR
ncbi:hypothetical protein CFD26_102119 [Aspergillus turcosus]|uniref:Uncharacterized protein n=1 Tax=Aspergillus turcosus TaxID=1245748 RepID=A0A3R7JEV9_9EURO|nr:hypothetical protein CFD26_102119 [Aspergillus turcosus]